MSNRVEVNLLLREDVAVDQAPLEELLSLVAETTLSHFELRRPSVTIVLSRDEELQQLNGQWRGLDKATDVLSFAEREGDSLASCSPKTFLGDVIISWDRAAVQAKELGHSLYREIAFLTLHGLLHLLGYDHMQANEETEMLSMQREIMAEIEKKYDIP